MITLLIKPDFLVCNDGAVLLLFNRYRERFFDKSTKGIKTYTLANFLDLIRRSFMKVCVPKRLINMNLDVYHYDEIPSLFKNMNRAMCFADDINPEKYCKLNQEIFGRYKDNVLQI